MENCCFSNIIFESCIFDFNSFNNCSFINCAFLNCSKLNTNLHCDFYNCNSNENDFIDENSTINESIKHELTEQTEDVLIKEILGMYLKVDGKTRRMRMISKLRETFEVKEKSFKKTFNALTKQGFIICNGDKSFITDEGIEYLQNN